MRVSLKPIKGVVDDSEVTEVTSILKEENVVGYSVFDTNGTPVQSKGVGETAIAVFANIFDQSTRIGKELGEAAPRPSVMFTGREMELIGLPLANANILILKEKTSGIRREYRHAG